MHINGVTHIHAASPLHGRGFSVTGDLSIVQRQPLAHKGRDNRFAEPLFDRTSVFPDTFDFKQLLRKYHERNGKLKHLVRLCSPF